MKRKRYPRFFRAILVRSRRILGRWERSDPAWLAWAPTWGASLLIHGVLTIVMAVLILVGSSNWGSKIAIETTLPKLDQDVTSLVEADVSGDPFTRNQSDSPPSFSMDPVTDSTALNQPELSLGAKFGDAINEGAALDPATTRIGSKDRTAALAALVAPFSGRQLAMKARLVRREGGTVASERAVSLGLDWIARHQRADGGWSLNYHQQCRGSGCPPQSVEDSDTAATGLALLPMLGAGHAHNAPGLYQKTVRGGIDWLVMRQKPDGDLFVGGAPNTHMYSHAIATIALCEAYGLTRDASLKEPASRAIRFIVNAQNPVDGGWRYQPRQSGDTSVFGWQMMALRSGRLAGLTVPKSTLKGAMIYLERAATNKTRASYSYQPGQGASMAMTAEALLVRQYAGWQRDLPALAEGSRNVFNDLMRSDQRNIYYWYYATQMLHNMRGESWKAWNEKARDRLVELQTTGTGCDRGSFHPLAPTADQWGGSGGRLYVTSLSILTLEVYYRYLPIYQLPQK
jgi:hypothetical protein